MYWQETVLSLDKTDLESVLDLGKGEHEITFVLSNDAGLETTVSIILDISQSDDGISFDNCC